MTTTDQTTEYVEGPKGLTSAYLRGLGFGSDFLGRLERDSMMPERARAAKWLQGATTRSGKERSGAIRRCGKIRLRLRSDGVLGVYGEQCRDRGCPRCQVRRSRELASELREAVTARRRDTKRRQLFVTLTQPKYTWQRERCGAAVSRCLDSWARATRSSSRKRNAAFRDTFSGGIRALEVTWSGRNTKMRNGGRVKFSGFHAHLHCVFEVAEGYTAKDFTRELLPVWEWAAPGVDVSRGVQVKNVDEKRVGQLAKYVTKPFDSPPHRAREIFEGLDGRQVHAGFGEWRSWRKWVEPEESEHDFAASVEPLDEIAARWFKYEERGRGGLSPEPVVFGKWKSCPVTGRSQHTAVAAASTSEIAQRLRAAARQANCDASKYEAERRIRSARRAAE